LLVTFGISSLLAQSVGLRLALRHLTEPQITRRCFSCSLIALSVFGVAWRAWMLYPAMLLLGISVGGFACVSSMASQVVPRAQTGEAQGVVTSLKALTEGLGPLATSAALPWFEETPLPGAPWLISAMWVALSLVLCLRLEGVLRRYAAGGASVELTGANGGCGSESSDSSVDETVSCVDPRRSSAADVGQPSSANRV
jgi:nitrate/nitrite transporter NarK